MPLSYLPIHWINSQACSHLLPTKFLKRQLEPKTTMLYGNYTYQKLQPWLQPNFSFFLISEISASSQVLTYILQRIIFWMNILAHDSV